MLLTYGLTMVSTSRGAEAMISVFVNSSDACSFTLDAVEAKTYGSVSKMIFTSSTPRDWTLD